VGKLLLDGQKGGAVVGVGWCGVASRAISWGRGLVRLCVSLQLPGPRREWTALVVVALLAGAARQRALLPWSSHLRLRWPTRHTPSDRDVRLCSF
jgi:hypothetical protein